MIVFTMPEVLTEIGEVGQAQHDELTEASIEFGWNVVLWNDDITPFPVVVAALVKFVELHEDQAIKAAMHIHQHGKGIVATVDREKAEWIKNQLEQLKLTVTLEQVST
jgi:ATP-dependent Clp protease adapter protein ClpS